MKEFKKGSTTQKGKQPATARNIHVCTWVTITILTMIIDYNNININIITHIYIIYLNLTYLYDLC